MEEELINDKPEFELDLDKAVIQGHNWVRRGIIVSCEGAGHPNHRHFLTKKE